MATNRVFTQTIALRSRSLNAFFVSLEFHTMLTSSEPLNLVFPQEKSSFYKSDIGLHIINSSRTYISSSCVMMIYLLAVGRPNKIVTNPTIEIVFTHTLLSKPFQLIH